VQDWLGHSTITMTMRYSHLAPGHGADLICALENPAAAGRVYERHRPEESVLFKVQRAHWKTFLAELESGADPPDHHLISTT